MRNRFDRELEQLNTDLIEMGALIEAAINNAADALLSCDRQKAENAMEYDQQVDEKEKEIERRCLKLLLQQQPVAADLRLISTALKMITDMERIGDQAEDISELSLRLMSRTHTADLGAIKEMASETISMVTGAIDAFVARDLAGAYAVVERDDVVDALFVRAKDDLIAMIRNESGNGEQAIDLIMIAKYLERIGDHATNIAEWVIFAITGEHKNTRVI